MIYLVMLGIFCQSENNADVVPTMIHADFRRDA